YAVREEANRLLEQTDGASGSATTVPSGAVLVPTVGVGGHCLPKDGILLWWRRHESGADTRHSLILQSRIINDESPAQTVRLAEQRLGSLAGRRVALMGTAYRFDSEDTRNSPTLVLARQLQRAWASVILHDPYVKPDDRNLRGAGLEGVFTNDAAQALSQASLAIFCVGHGVYANDPEALLALAPRLEAIL